MQLPLYAQSIFKDGFETPHTLPTCANDPDPNNFPSGYIQHIVPWEDAFFGNTFPNVSNGGLSPTGSFTLRSRFNSYGLPMAGRYLSIPFVPQANSSYKIKWFKAQAIYSRGYYANHPADSVFVTISPCPGDFRLADSNVPPTNELSPRCRKYAPDSDIFYGTTGGGAQCTLIAGQTYFLNIIHANPYGGLDPREDTCADGNLCDSNFGD